jgi:hypothetical protein
MACPDLTLKHTCIASGSGDHSWQDCRSASFARLPHFLHFCHKLDDHYEELLFWFTLKHPVLTVNDKVVPVHI